MKITIEYYRIFILSGIFFFAGSFIASFINFEIPYVIPILVGHCAIGALVALTNIKNGHIKAYWKKENKNLIIPFQNGGGKLIAYDENDNEYSMGILLFPKKTK